MISSARRRRRSVLHCPGAVFKTVLPIAGHILTDNPHSGRTDTALGRPRGLAGVPFVCNFRSFLSSYTFIRAYLRERASGHVCVSRVCTQICSGSK